MKLFFASFLLLFILLPSGTFAREIKVSAVRSVEVKKVVPEAPKVRTILGNSDTHKTVTTATPRRPVIESFVLTGEINALNVASSSIAVKIKTIDQYSQRKNLREKIVTIVVPANTDIKRPGLRKAQLKDLLPGLKVTIRGKVIDGIFNTISVVVAGKPRR